MEEKKEPKKLTLKDLASPAAREKVNFEKDADKFKPLDINEIAPKKPNFNPEDTPIVKAYKDLDNAIERKKSEVKERIDKAKKEIIEAQVEESLSKEAITPKEESVHTLDDSDPLDAIMDDIEEPEVASNVQEAIKDSQTVLKIDKEPEKEEAPVKEVNTTIESTSELLKKQEEDIFKDDEEESEDTFLEEEGDEDSDESSSLSEEDKNKEKEELVERRKKALEEYKAKVKECLSTMSGGSKTLNLKNFKIRRTPITYSKFLAERAVSSKQDPKAHVSTWILPNSGRTVTMSEFSGTDLEALGDIDDGLNALQKLTRFYSTIYRHVVDPNKPKTLEAWLKTVSLVDVNHLNFAIYKASFEQSNYVTEICNNKKCLAMDLVKHPIMDMVKFKDEETKAKYMDLFNKENTTPSKVEETVVQINDRYVFGLRFPSIYHGLFESTQISRAIALKHQALLANMAFISSIYIINESAEELIPLDFKHNANSFKDTVENKFKIIARVLKEFTPDEFAYLQKSIVDLSNAQFENPGDIKYVFPASKCSKCGSDIAEREEENPITMVFTRLQLTQGLN